MTQPRKNIVSLNDTPFYHCMSRCVRRAFLCGIDHYSGNDYEHRRDWLESKLHEVASIFSIKLCAYAIMSNHYHVVLHVRSDIANDWTDYEVVERWHRLYSGSVLSSRFLNKTELSQTELSQTELSQAELEMLSKDIQQWRERLCSISWFMRVVNEFIAIKANREDKCTGRFWEGRFKSQALLDEKALLSCMAYVDLNPIRAKMASTPESSDYTCVKARIAAKQTNISNPKTIERFVGSKQDLIGLPFLLEDYLELVDWSGRIIREDKRGAIEPTMPPILQRLEISKNSWKELTLNFEAQFSHWVGSEQIVRKIYHNKKYQRIPKLRSCSSLFG
jgi:REP element-mobilizing transposase RayT